MTANQCIKAERESAGNTRRAPDHQTRRRGLMADAVQSQNPPKRKKKLSRERLAALFLYDPDSGRLSWKVRPGIYSKVRPGDRAGCSTHGGYRIIKFDRVPYYEHRVIWTLVTGADPDNQLDHINGDKSDNRIYNLREASGHQNRHNVLLSASNSSGFKGVVWNKRDGNWRSGLRYKGKYLFFGYFDDKIEAAAVYNFHSRRLLGEFSRTNPIPEDREIVDPHGGVS
jgi:hypothetical protein